MHYKARYTKEIEKTFFKLKKKNISELRNINKKINQILKNPHHYKPLRKNLYGLYRVHINKSFVLTFEIDETSKRVTFIDYDHHDKIYKKRYFNPTY